MNLAEICDYAKRAREYALLGIYDSSIVYYEGVIQQIHKHCQTLRDPALKVKWQQVSCPHPCLCSRLDYVPLSSVVDVCVCV